MVYVANRSSVTCLTDISIEHMSKSWFVSKDVSQTSADIRSLPLAAILNGPLQPLHRHVLSGRGSTAYLQVPVLACMWKLAHCSYI